jgi:hypothetical protein
MRIPSPSVRVRPVVVSLVAGFLLVSAQAFAQAGPPPPITIGAVTISGFVQADGIFTHGGDAGGQEPLDTFAIPRARVGLGGDITPKFSWYLQGDFANLTNDGRVLRDAWLQYTGSPQFAVRFGQLVAPFSLERLTSYQKLELIDRSVIGSFLAPSRDMGLMVFNPRPWRGWLTWAGAVINGVGQNKADDNDAKDVVGRVATRLPGVTGLTLGVNAQTGEQPQGTRDRVGVDLNLEGRQYRVAVERVQQRRRYETTIDTGGYSVIGAFKHPAGHPTTHYAGYEVAARYVDVVDDAVALTSQQVQAGGTYFVTPYLRVMSNVVLPIGEDQPRHATRWWSRLQYNF